MKVIDHIQATKSILFSFKILPPMKGKSIQSIYDGIDPLMEFKPKFINVTYHREKFIYKERDHGLLEKIAIRKRSGTVGICAEIMNNLDVDTFPHLICGGFSKEETENALIDFPEILSKEIVKCKDNTAISELGIEWGKQQSRELRAAGVPCIHYYTMSNSSSVKAIAAEIF